MHVNREEDSANKIRIEILDQLGIWEAVKKVLCILWQTQRSQLSLTSRKLKDKALSCIQFNLLRHILSPAFSKWEHVFYHNLQTSSLKDWQQGEENAHLTLCSDRQSFNHSPGDERAGKLHLTHTNLNKQNLMPSPQQCHPNHFLQQHFFFCILLAALFKRT